MAYAGDAHAYVQFQDVSTSRVYRYRGDIKPLVINGMHKCPVCQKSLYHIGGLVYVCDGVCGSETVFDANTKETYVSVTDDEEKVLACHALGLAVEDMA